MAELLDMLGDVGPIVAALGGILAGLVTLVKNGGKLRRLLMPSDNTQLTAELRLLAETRLEMINTLSAQLVDEREAHEKTRDERDYARESADQCDRRLRAAERKLLETMERS